MTNVSLTIDYSNGSQKLFTTIPWSQRLTILEVLQAAVSISPGLLAEFTESREGWVMDLSLDGVPNEAQPGEWSIWVNERPGPGSLGTTTAFNIRPHKRAENEVKAGDRIVAKLVTAPVAPA